ncbi:MAG: hypothetical protein ACO1OQ_01125 [Rufibacter sp.]
MPKQVNTSVNSLSWYNKDTKIQSLQKDSNLPDNTNTVEEGELLGQHHQNQMQRFYEYLQVNVATASMAASAIGVPQKNITRYKRMLEEAGKLWETTKAKCRETGFIASYLTTDKTKAPIRTTIQLSLF